jgi:hypothetical protein
MGNIRATCTGLALTMLLLADNPAIAQSPVAQKKVADVAAPKPEQVTTPGQRSSFLPADFNPPTSVDTTRFKLMPLSPALAKVDFDAYMSSIEHLQTTFSRSTNWPRSDISSADAMRDMENEQARFKSRKSFAYAVLTPDGSRERGSVYVSPSPDKSYDAVVRLWVTKAEYDAGFDAELYKWVTNWIKTDWPFHRIAYPGRSIDWQTWDSIVATNKPKAVPVEKPVKP